MTKNLNLIKFKLTNQRIIVIIMCTPMLMDDQNPQPQHVMILSLRPADLHYFMHSRALETYLEQRIELVAT